MLTNERNHFMLTDAQYEFAKKLVQIVLPAFSALYFGLASIWGLPNAEQVVGTLAVVATFLGVCLGVSAREYKASGAAYDGDMVVTPKADGTAKFTMELDLGPEELANKDSVNFKIEKRDMPTPPVPPRL